MFIRRAKPIHTVGHPYNLFRNTKLHCYFHAVSINLVAKIIVQTVTCDISLCYPVNQYTEFYFILFFYFFAWLGVTPLNWHCLFKNVSAVDVKILLFMFLNWLMIIAWLGLTILTCDSPSCYSLHQTLCIDLSHKRLLYGNTFTQGCVGICVFPHWTSVIHCFVFMP